MARRDPYPSEQSPLLGEAAQQNGDAENAENGQLPQSGDNGTDNGREPPNAFLLLPALAIGLLLSALDQLIIVASYTKIGNDLHALNNVGWVATSYLLAITSFQPLFGKFCDIFGRKESLLSAYVLFGLGCLLCGVSQSLVQLCLSRAIAGIGGGGMTAVVSIILSDIVPLRERGVWQGYLNLIYSLGTSSGAPLGGLLADTIGWRWAFIGQAPLCLVAFATVHFYLDLPRPPADHWLAKVRRVDFLGAFTLIAATVSLFIGIDIGSNRGWSQLTAIVPIAISPVLFGLFVFIEMRVASHPFAPGHVIFSPGMFPSYLCNFFTIGAMFGCLFFAPLYFQAVRGDSATKGGIYLIPMMICTVAASLGAGFYVKKTEKYYWHTLWANAITGLAMVPLIFGIWYNHILMVIISLCMIGISGGSVVTTTLVALLANAAEEDTAVVVACSYLFRSLGSSLGITISAAVLQQLLRGELAKRLPSGDQARDIEKQVRQNLDYINKLSKEMAAIVRTSYLHACAGAIVPLFICGILAFVCSIWIREKSLKR